VSQRGKGTPPPQRRGRTAVPVWLLAAAALAALLLVFSFERIAPGERAFRLSGRQAAAPLAPGLHFHLPFTGRTIHLGAGPIVVRGEVPLHSTEGASLAATYEVSAGVPDASVGRVLDGAGTSADLEERIRQAAVAAIETWGRGRSGEAIALGEGRANAEESIRNSLQAEGFDPVAVRLGNGAGSAEMQAKLGAEAVRRRTAQTGLKVAILGLDGADWEILDPLIKAGRTPNLAGLKARAAYGPMKSMDPMLSPILWTTAATGKPPDEHGVIDFLVRDAATGKPTPVSSRARKVKALWNVLGDVGRTSAFVGWWATWPAEEIDGTMVSDRVAYSTFSFTPGLKDAVGATWPPDYFEKLRPLLVQADDIPDRDLRRFADATPDEFRRLAKIVAGARSYQAAGLDLLARGQPDLFSVYYQGIDEVGHRFQHFMPPKMGMVSAEDFQRYHGTVEAYYVYQDELIGQVLSRLDRRTVVIVMSDHGFRNGTGRPSSDPPYVEGKPGLWHRRYGIFMMAGPETKPGPLDTTSLLDIAPTALYLLGLPKAEDMPGRVVEEAIAPEFLARFPRQTIPTYEPIGRPLQSGTLVAGGAPQGEVEKEMMEKLRSLGYISGGDAEGATPGVPSDPGAGGGSAGAASPGAATLGGGALITAHINEGTLRLKAKDYARAEASVAEALKLSPDFPPALLLKAQIAREKKDYATAIAAARRVLEIDAAGERLTYTQIARLYADAGRIDEGLQYLRGQVAAHPDFAEPRAALGALLLKSGDKVAAERELLAALQIDPSLGDPLTELHTLYQGTAKIPTLEGIVRKGLALNEQSVVHHNWMGLILEWNHDLPGAEREYRRAMELDPDYPATMANLGAMYGRSNRLEEAVTILKRAVAKDDSNLEAWVNLGAAQGRLQHPKEAIAALETARGKLEIGRHLPVDLFEGGLKTTTLYNALALAYLQDGQNAKGVGYLEESLVIDPNQQEARQLLAAVKKRAS
jgi:predicted AlkP superfamily phosphohydrolase/phosphomutase/tetratricopeptide (TPR) repeat protein